MGNNSDARKKNDKHGQTLSLGQMNQNGGKITRKSESTTK